VVPGGIKKGQVHIQNVKVQPCKSFLRRTFRNLNSGVKHDGMNQDDLGCEVFSVLFFGCFLFCSAED
jgi:hypothetical protein